MNQSLSQYKQLASENQLVPSLAAGLIVGVLVVIMQVSLAALIFSGDLAPFVANGIGDDRITIEAHGERRHIASNETELGRVKNRRVVIQMAQP